ncbi:MAG: response regulator [Planctomycetaceae bacterium]|jgi:putative two-component system response regulator|nr:response regulator [Planctomycetaceae bacterium]
MENELKTVLLVDDDLTNLVNAKNVLGKHFEVFTIPSGEKLFKILERVTPDIILLDVEMPEMNGYEVIKNLKSNPKTADIPVIFLTARIDIGSELEGLTLGAVDYITKPFAPSLLLKRVENHLLTESQKRLLQIQNERISNYNINLHQMVEAKTQTVRELQNAIFDILAEVIEYRDDETGGHINRTQQYFRILLDGLQNNRSYQDEIAEWDWPLLILSSQLHDIGKIAISDAILLKPAKLTPEEFEIMQTHTVLGGEIIERIEKNTTDHLFIQYAKLMALTHHEKWDGSGYPHKLSGTDIPLQGRLMAVVDVYDALVSKRPYKIPFTHEKAVQIICESNGTHFDPAIIDIFCSVADKIEQAIKKE